MNAMIFDRERDRIVAAVHWFCTSASGQSQLLMKSETLIFRMIKLVIGIREHCVQLDVANIIEQAPTCS